MLRPRYSLLTLLVLTALVAGGVKLWYGPHHVVEREGEYYEEEYTYYKNWDGTNVINGPHVVRAFHPNGSIIESTIRFYRNGKQFPWEYHLENARPSEIYSGIPRIKFLRNYQMSTEEQAECEQIIKVEYQRFITQVTAVYDRLFEAASETSWRSIYLE